MIITTTYNLPDEAYVYSKAYHAEYAWEAIQESLDIIRKHYKYGQGTIEETLTNVQAYLADARSRIDP